jgi:hypothetical protein
MPRHRPDPQRTSVAIVSVTVRVPATQADADRVHDHDGQDLRLLLGESGQPLGLDQMGDGVVNARHNAAVFNLLSGDAPHIPIAERR